MKDSVSSSSFSSLTPPRFLSALNYLLSSFFCFFWMLSSSAAMGLTLRDPSLRTILITGGNRGIGFEVVRQLLSSCSTTAGGTGSSSSSSRMMNVIATARQPSSAQDLIELQKQYPTHLYIAELDVASETSQAALRDSLEGIKLDCLINNAGIYTGGKNPVHNPTTMMKTNYYGPQKLSSLLKSNLNGANSLIINVSSGMGSLSGFSRQAQETLLNPTLTEQQLDELVHQYCSGKRKIGWPSDPYSASKGALNTLTRIRSSRGSDSSNMVAVCPGWVRTDMGGSAASRSVQQGADTIVWLATLAQDDASSKEVNGKMFRDRKEIDW